VQTLELVEVGYAFLTASDVKIAMDEIDARLEIMRWLQDGVAAILLTH
jgi:hypothetical protein